ncbi:hypothetical protein ACPPVT_21520 [Angustibacter sp. McL0619]|uniref:hypothetical protein n=1 Tax=Angustibacter sp. McL0619 TaxID=3415676 RepID=UPI003CE69FEE
MNDNSECSLDDLRDERRRLVETVANLSWLRRLVVARSDLEVARLTGLASGVQQLEPVVRDALALGSSSGPELLHALSRSCRTLHEQADQARSDLDAVTGALVSALAVDPGRCLAG